MSGAERVPRRAAALVGLALALVLTGCSPAAPKPTTPSPTQTPYFASEDAALDAATKTYTRFVALSDQVLQAGGQGDEVYKQVLTGKALKAELSGSARFRRLNHHSTGMQVVDGIKGQQWHLMDSEGRDVVTIYACLDVSAVNVLDASGQSVVDPDRRQVFDKVVTFDYSKEANNHLLISDDTYWQGDEFCPLA